MPPFRKTEDHLLAVQAELAALEPIFHHPELGTSREAYEAMTEECFWETGASGRCYSREQVIETLLQRYATPHEERWVTSDFCCQEVAQGMYLLTYTLAQEDRLTRRATLWRRASSGWKIVYHQGTVVAQLSPAAAS
jgi:hypothetical protein